MAGRRSTPKGLPLHLSMRLTGDWRRALSATQPTSFERKLKAAIMRGTFKEAQWCRRQIIDGITSQSPAGKPFKKLSWFTLRARKLSRFRGTKALIRSGELRKSVVVEPNSPAMETFVGVSRKAKSGGKSLVNIAEIHEFGAKVPVTPKMRAYLLATTGIGLKQSTKVIIIPARPFLSPIFKKYYSTRAKTAERIMLRVVGEAAGLLGR